MFKVYFNYNGKDIALYDCYGLSFSPARRNMYVKVKENGRLITHSYYTRLVQNLMFSF